MKVGWVVVVMLVAAAATLALGSGHMSQGSSRFGRSLGKRCTLDLPRQTICNRALGCR